MTSSAKAPAKKAGWGSLLSGAVAGLESRLDTILADDNEASARSRAAEQALKEVKSAPGLQKTSANLAPPKTGSRDASRTRVNDRLAERLAKATAAKNPSQTPSGVPSRVASPPLAESGRTSLDSRKSAEIPRVVSEAEKPDESIAEKKAEEEKVEQQDGQVEEQTKEIITEAANNGTLIASSLPINPAKISIDSGRPSIDVSHDGSRNDTSARPSTEIAREDLSSRPSSDLPTGRSAAEVEAEMMRMLQQQAEQESQRQEEMQTLLEKVDALQSKLQYLAKETVAAAKEANASGSTVSSESKLAEKDEKIALLMQEGENLSKTELRHLQTIKKLRVKNTEDEKLKLEMKKKLDRLERTESDLKSKIRRADVAERQANEKTKTIAAIETQVEQLREDRESASELIRNLTAQLKESKERADRAEKDAKTKAAEFDKNKFASLENDLEDLRIEKKLAEDRAVSETQKIHEEAETAKQRFGVRELELKNEIASLDSKLEAMRVRAEEASAEGAGGSEGNVKLIRQVETLQIQYSVAKENWETIEGSLNARLAAMEKERDESIRREAEMRKKARDVGVRARKTEEQVEVSSEKISSLEAELQTTRDLLTGLKTRLESTETALEDARAESERQRKIWDAELTQRIEEEKLKWNNMPGQQQPSTPRNEPPWGMSRKPSATNAHTMHSSRRSTRMSSHDLFSLTSIADRPSSSSRRSSALAPSTPNQNEKPPPLHRQESINASISSLETPIDEHENDTSTEVDFMNDSPDRTIADFVSHSTAGVGPSVQLVERMSAAVRRLESEKAAFKDELARLAAQRDAARDDVVGLMREVEEKRESDRRGDGLDAELTALRQRYDGALELLGEREEEAEELRGDVAELKRIYRELVERRVGP